ncbi:MAG: PrsW family intramembrane metalloprotease [Anaerolineae bacterium]|jgi:RsiW-degrading membrane proteinase PrsW (M82 family)
MLVPAVATLAALIPMVIYIAFVWWLDRYEKEPLWLLALAFLWGAIPAAIISVFLELALDAPIAALGGESLLADLASVSISAPLIEESAKGMALIILVLLFQREFDDVLDGIVYGAMIGFGFAFSENLFAYLYPILSQEGLASGLMTAWMRTVVFGFNHAFWTGITGAAVGYARLSRSWAQRLLVPLGGWSVAVLFHAIHNAGATLVRQTFCLSLGVSLVVDWGGLLLLLGIALMVLRKERQWIERGLVEEVRRGALSPQEFDLLRNAGQRMWVRWNAWGRGGRMAYRSVGRYYQCATELAFKKHHLRSLGDEGGNLAEIQRLREVLAASRVLAWPWLWRT